MTQTISIVLASTLYLASIVACVGPPPAPVAVCEALRPDMPVKYHGGPDGKGGPGYDTRDTIDRARSVNARFEAACPPTVR